MSTELITLPTGVKVPALPDSDRWINRFNVHSATSNRVYVVSQHRENRHWGCSCPGWRTHRKCKHLTEIGLPVKEQPYEITG